MNHDSQRRSASEAPPISDYAFLADCHSAVLVSRDGSIDWCCMPRIDSRSCFGRLLDWDRGGYCRIAPAGDYQVQRQYCEDSLIVSRTLDLGIAFMQQIEHVVKTPGHRTDFITAVDFTDTLVIAALLCVDDLGNAFYRSE